ncbi:putative G-protein coupled receptor [Mycena sanguinolenta]|uniref:Putative G-protein coupled receptor n=1 Tax=Mycena sanguinolenta TaxID=230812 RepID=A0A8H7DIB1_9AGAR|nr:putative G-protein coupled receptor [Mycena sanguinolenta]
MHVARAPARRLRPAQIPNPRARMRSTCTQCPDSLSSRAAHRLASCLHPPSPPPEHVTPFDVNRRNDFNRRRPAVRVLNPLGIVTASSRQDAVHPHALVWRHDATHMRRIPPPHATPMQGQASTFGARRSTFIARRLSSPAPFRPDVDAFLAKLPFFSAWLPRPHRAALNSLADSALDFLADFPPPLAHAPHSTHPAEDSTAAGGEGGDGFPTEAEALARRITDGGLSMGIVRLTTQRSFIPLTHPHWLRLPLSVFTLHNETLNIHTHLLPLLAWGLAFAGFDLGPLPLWLKPLAPMARVASISARKLGKVHPVRCVVRVSFLINTRKHTTHTRPPPNPSSPSSPLLCLLSSALWHTMAGCAHKRAIETCARIDYVGIGWLIAVSVGAVVRWGYGCGGAAVRTFTPLWLWLAAGWEEDKDKGARSWPALPRRTPRVDRLGVRRVDLGAHSGVRRPRLRLGVRLLVAYLDSLGSLTSFASVFEYAAASLPSVASMHASLSSLLATMPTYHPVYSRFGTGSIGWRIGSGASSSLSASPSGPSRPWPASLSSAVGRHVAVYCPIVPSLLYYLVGLVIYAAHVPSGGLSATMDAEAYGGAGVGRVGERYVWGEVSVLRLSTIFMLESHEDSVYLAKLAVEVLSITYKVIGTRHTLWRIVFFIEQKEAKGNTMSPLVSFSFHVSCCHCPYTHTQSPCIHSLQSNV